MSQLQTTRNEFRFGLRDRYESKINKSFRGKLDVSMNIVIPIHKSSSGQSIIYYDSFWLFPCYCTIGYYFKNDVFDSI